MLTKLAINDKLIEEARRIGGHRTKRAAVTAALNEYIQRRKQIRIIQAFGTIEYDEKYDYKKSRLLDRIEPADSGRVRALARTLRAPKRTGALAPEARGFQTEQ
jgi:Bacterial antitoxin of type II TA system, VapB